MPACAVACDDVVCWEWPASWWYKSSGSHGIAEDVAECWVAGLWLLVFILITPLTEDGGTARYVQPYPSERRKP